MKKFLFVCTLAFLAACGQESTAPSPAAADTDAAQQNAAVAQVGPQTITRAQLDQQIQLLDENDRAFARTPVGRRNLVQVLVREQLQLLDAHDKELDKSDLYLAALEEKRAELKEIYDQYAQQLLAHLWENYQRDTGTLHITEDEIAAYYKKYPYEMTIKQIIISDAQTADAVWRELKRAKSRWKALEKQYSVAPEQSKGKDISFMPGEFIPELEVIAANSPTGSVQGFVKTSQGFHIIMKTGERRLSLKDAAPRIRAILENQKMDAALNALQKTYEVVIYD